MQLLYQKGLKLKINKIIFESGYLLITDPMGNEVDYPINLDKQSWKDLLVHVSCKSWFDKDYILAFSLEMLKHL